LKKKLIEVALPLEAINKESAREKSIRHGHPSTLHLWWARRPLAACRAVLFASLVDDPGSRPDLYPTEEQQTAAREELFDLIKELVLWKNANNESVLRRAREAIRLSAGPEGPPPVYDPFCGGGSIPLEAQRLGLKAYGSDLNPVAVLITKALIEIPPKFAGQPPLNPDWRTKASKPGMWRAAAGLAEDVRYYGKWMRDRAEERIGHLYPKAQLKDGSEATVIAWLWARTVTCPNPACGATMPLVRSFALSTKKGKEAWVEPVIEPGCGSVRFAVASGDGNPSGGTVGRRGAKCPCCGTNVKLEHIRAEGRAGRMHAQMLAIVAEGEGGRVYLEASEDHRAVAGSARPLWVPSTELPERALSFRVQAYGMMRHRDLFTNRQLVALSTFADLVAEANKKAVADGLTPDRVEAVTTYLALLVSRLANTHNTIAIWSPSRDQSKNAFSRQAIPMTWDYVEVNPFAGAAGDFGETADNLAGAIAQLPASSAGRVTQVDCSAGLQTKALFCTDPPYYDNIGYADLSDFFYVWLRKMLCHQYPGLFSTVLVPKAAELIATPYRFGGSKAKAQEHFEAGFARAFETMRQLHNSDYPLTVFYAFKQSETEEDEDNEGEELVASTGWETMLEGLLTAGFSVYGTWPMRSERGARAVAIGTNALASSIVLVCRPRLETAPTTTRKDFLTALKREMPPSLRKLQQGNIAPVDLSQAAIGPGMAVFSRYSKVLENDGSPMKVRTALQLINQTLDEVLSEQESDFDADTRFALTWFEQRGFEDGPYGDAETLATARAISVSGLTESGIASARAGRVKLIARKDLPPNWDPSADGRLTVWEATQYLIRALEENGELGAAELAAKLGVLGGTARELAYRLYALCERKGWTEEAIAYNSLVVSWPAIIHLVKDLAKGSSDFELTAG
jgi:putative DNA methylase